MTKIQPEARKAILLEQLRDVRRRILNLASQLEVGQQEEAYLGSWSVREMLAHLAGWDDTNRRAAGEILDDRVPSFYHFSGKDWAAYNEQLVAKYSRDNFDELLSLVQSTHEKLLNQVEKLPAGELWLDRGIRAKGWKVTISRLLEVEALDEEEHYSQLEQFATEQRKP